MYVTIRGLISIWMKQPQGSNCEKKIAKSCDPLPLSLSLSLSLSLQHGMIPLSGAQLHKCVDIEGQAISADLQSGEHPHPTLSSPRSSLNFPCQTPTHIHTHTHTPIHTHIRTHTHTSEHDMCIHTHAHTYTYLCTHMYTHTHTHVHTHIHNHAHSHTYSHY